MTQQESSYIRPTYLLFALGMIASVTVVAQFAVFPVFLQCFINACACVYVGSYMAAKVSSKKEDRKLERAAVSADAEHMTSKDAYMFPLYGSAVLFSIYIAYKILPKEYLNIIFTCHFMLIGLFCLTSLLELPIGKFAPAKWRDIQVIKKKFTINLYFTKQDIDLDFNYLQCICLSIALFPTILYILSKHWITNNLFGIAFSIVGVMNLNLPTFKVGFILLWGLFFYDIFWVYGTDVMVTVAKSFDAPIKLLFPYDWEALPPKFSMLGLGDIVIPGIFVALCLKYDVDRALQKGGNKSINSIPTPVFNSCFIGYCIGIAVTFFVMVIFQHPQPALLFLVPACTFSVLIYAYLNGKTKDLFAYEEHPENAKKARELEEEKKVQDESKKLDAKKVGKK